MRLWHLVILAAAFGVAACGGDDDAPSGPAADTAEVKIRDPDEARLELGQLGYAAGEFREAVDQSDVLAIALFIDAGMADPDSTYVEEDPLLIYTVKYGPARLVAVLMERGADVDIRGEYGETALMAAAENGKLDLVRLLVEAGADVNAQHEGGWTALAWAEAEGHTEVVEYLREHGARE